MFSLFCSYLSVSFYEPLVCGYFFEFQRSACAQLLCADAYLSSQSELCSVGEACWGVPVYAGCVYLALEGTGGAFVIGDYALAVSGTVEVDVL